MGYGRGSRSRKVAGAGKPRKPKKLSPWLAHVADVRSRNPGMSYKDAMKRASASYVR